MRTPFCLVLACTATGVAAQPRSLFSPIGAQVNEGNGNNLFPWDHADPRRYQQIHSDLIGPAQTFSRLSFRGDAGNTTNYTGTWACDLELFMGDSVAWDEAVFTYRGNSTGPLQRVFGRRVLDLGPQGQNQLTGPLPFTVHVPFDTPWPTRARARSCGTRASTPTR